MQLLIIVLTEHKRIIHIKYFRFFVNRALKCFLLSVTVFLLNTLSLNTLRCPYEGLFLFPF